MYSVHPVSQKEAIVKDRPLAIPNNIYINSSFLLVDSLVRQMLWEEQTEHWRCSGTDITDYMFLLMILCGSIHVLYRLLAVKPHAITTYSSELIPHSCFSHRNIQANNCW